MKRKARSVIVGAGTARSRRRWTTRMKLIAFITEYAVVDRIIDHLKLTFAAAKPPPFHVFEQVPLAAAEEREGYF